MQRLQSFNLNLIQQIISLLQRNSPVKSLQIFIFEFCEDQTALRGNPCYKMNLAQFRRRLLSPLSSSDKLGILSSTHLAQSHDPLYLLQGKASISSTPPSRHRWL